MDMQSLASLARASLLSLGIAAAGAFAQTAEPWPSRPLRVVVPYVAGAMGDVVARRVADGEPLASTEAMRGEAQVAPASAGGVDRDERAGGTGR